MHRSCSDSPLTASQMDGVFGSDSQLSDQLEARREKLIGGKRAVRLTHEPYGQNIETAERMEAVASLPKRLNWDGG